MRGLAALMVVMAMLPIMAVVAGDTSDATFVYVNPKSCYHWHTATNSTMELPVCFPPKANSASLSVNGSVCYSGITTNRILVSLPAPRRGLSEDVYDLALEFDDGTVYTARLGLINGYWGCGDTGSTRCITPVGDKVWGKVDGFAVIPIPYGTILFTSALDGGAALPVDTGLDGAAGWYAIKIAGMETADITATTPYEVFAASLHGTLGLIITIR